MSSGLPLLVNMDAVNVGSPFPTLSSGQNILPMFSSLTLASITMSDKNIEEIVDRLARQKMGYIRSVTITDFGPTLKKTKVDQHTEHLRTWQENILEGLFGDDDAR